jgi:hypothetical protein
VDATPVVAAVPVWVYFITTGVSAVPYYETCKKLSTKARRDKCQEEIDEGYLASSDDWQSYRRDDYQSRR